MVRPHEPQETDDRAERQEVQEPDSHGPPPMPRWVKALLIATLVVALLVAVLLLSGHGPRLHAPATEVHGLGPLVFWIS